MTSCCGIPFLVACRGAKSACLGMVRTLATEVSPHGVRVNFIAPGWIESDMMLKALASAPERPGKFWPHADELYPAGRTTWAWLRHIFACLPRALSGVWCCLGWRRKY